MNLTAPFCACGSKLPLNCLKCHVEPWWCGSKLQDVSCINADGSENTNINDFIYLHI